MTHLKYPTAGFFFIIGWLLTMLLVLPLILITLPFWFIHEICKGPIKFYARCWDILNTHDLKGK